MSVYLEAKRLIDGASLDRTNIPGEKIISTEAAALARDVLDKRADTKGGGMFVLTLQWWPDGYPPKDEEGE